MTQVEAWLTPLSGEDGPCGADLEYENAFLELSKAAEGKPETQFEKATPPDWRAVRGQAENIFDRTRDLRVALMWMRAVVSLEGVVALPAGLRLVNGLLETHWSSVHPVPDPGDNDPYARVNALAMLPLMGGFLGELLNARLVLVKGLGDIRLRDVEVAFTTLNVREGETTYTREQLERILVTADQEGAGIRDLLLAAQQGLKQLGALMDLHFGSGSASDLKPLLDLFTHALTLVPAAQTDEAGAESGVDGDGDAALGGGAASGSGKAGLSGSVNSRTEAIRAIELVCAFLERHEPTNPAQLFLRRARSLLERNFLELLKELAPGALDEVARIVGVDPNTVGEQEQ